MLQETKLKLEWGHSVSDIKQHLRNATTVFGGNQIPITRPEVLKLMKMLGYSEPRHYKVCVSTTHSVLLQRHHWLPNLWKAMAKLHRLLLFRLTFLWLVWYWRTVQPAYWPLAWERRLAQQAIWFCKYSVRTLAWAKISWNIMVLGSSKWVLSSWKVPSLPKNVPATELKKKKKKPTQ